MKKHIIKKLALESYTRGNIDEGIVEKAVKILNRSSLKDYIRNLKNLEAKMTVTVTLASEDEMDEAKLLLKKVYPSKKIIVKIDPNLITGIKIVDYDNEYEFSLKESLEESLNYITQND